MKISIVGGTHILQHIGILVIKSVGLPFEVVPFFFDVWSQVSVLNEVGILPNIYIAS